MADFYAELPINIKITGNYHDMGAFASDVAQLPRIVTLNDVSHRQRQGHADAWTPSAKTFRYLDEDEMAKQRALAQRTRGARNEARRASLPLPAALVLAGCGGECHQDLRAWMAEQGKGVRASSIRLPQIKPYEPFAYNAFDLPDPFKPRKIEPAKGDSEQARARPDAPQGAARGLPAGVAEDGRHARERQDDATRW